MNERRRIEFLLAELEERGAVFALTPDGGWTIQGMSDVLTPFMHSTLEASKREIWAALIRHCPFCRAQVPRHQMTVQDDLIYLDTVCSGCGEVIDTVVPGQLDTTVIMADDSKGFALV